MPSLGTAAAADALRDGGVLLLATDTLPGLHCRADDPAAIARIIAAKGRPDGKPMLVLAGSTEQALALATPLSPDQREACRRCWPGPFSLILPAGSAAPAAVTGEAGTLAVRVPDVAALRELILLAGAPLVSTSANRSGEAPAVDLSAAAAVFAGTVDGRWGQDPPAGTPPQASALVDLTAAPFRVLRTGPAAFPLA